MPQCDKCGTSLSMGEYRRKGGEVLCPDCGDFGVVHWGEHGKEGE